ncbi:MAG: hypothetical protein ABI193_17130, partial [Minicystis sp.]
MHARLAFHALALSASLGACAEHRLPGPPPSGTSPPSLEAPAVENAGLATPEGVSAGAIAADGGSWIEAVRLERWSEVATRIDALPEAERAR